MVARPGTQPLRIQKVAAEQTTQAACLSEPIAAESAGDEKNCGRTHRPGRKMGRGIPAVASMVSGILVFLRIRKFHFSAVRQRAPEKMISGPGSGAEPPHQGLLDESRQVAGRMVRRAITGFEMWYFGARRDATDRDGIYWERLEMGKRRIRFPTNAA